MIYSKINESTSEESVNRENSTEQKDSSRTIIQSAFHQSEYDVIRASILSRYLIEEEQSGFINNFDTEAFLKDLKSISLQK